ncbi:MAG: DUF2478 domain-containing protein [Sedimentisphaerales bacterium]|nr:DUF2478 domain-containing protein [Sedimentisphaerales bacterium]
MFPANTQVIFWRGPKHSGKTSAAAGLADFIQAQGFRVAGFLSVSIYEDSELVGFDLLDFATRVKTPLARNHEMPDSAENTGKFFLSRAGLEAGIKILTAPATCRSDLVIVDEFGPLELEGRGWRNSLEALMSEASGVILVVVRDELIEQVASLYSHKNTLVLLYNSPCAQQDISDLVRNK